MKQLFIFFLLFITTTSQAQYSRLGFLDWIDDAHYLERKMDENKTEVLAKVNAKTGAIEMPYEYPSPARAVQKALPEGFQMNWNSPHTEDYELVIFTKDNNLYLFEKASKKMRQLTANLGAEKNPTFSPDNKHIAFTREGNLYTISLETGLETGLTIDGSDFVYNGWASWVYYEEILGRNSHYKAFWWSPDSKQLAYLRFDDSPVPVFPIYRSTGVHGELEKMHYPKVGDPNPLVALGICNLETTKTTWVDIDKNIDQYIAWPFWTKDSKQLLFQQMPRDQNKIELLLANPKDGSTKKVYEESRPTWVEFFQDIHMLEDNSGFILRSYKNDWYNLYKIGFDGKLNTSITDVKWRINSIDKVDEKKNVIYFSGTGTVNTDVHFFSVNMDGSNLKQLTKGTGSHYAALSPNGSYFVDRYSNVSTAPSRILYNNKGKEIRSISKSETPKLDPEKHHPIELFRVKSTDGKFDLPVAMTLPNNFNKNTTYPVVFSIYGGPDAGGISDSWRGWSGNSLTRMGVIVISVAHRGSGKFGKAGLDYMHRNLGKWEMEDYFAVVNWLKKQSFVDPDRIGITGSSYGGYLSAMALTYGADYFTHGIASLSVMDWQLYDNVYTERYMDTYEQNPAGYDQGSVLSHVDKYKGKLLITHGLMDDNVHVQNSIQLIDKLQDAGKEFEMMFYPNERHGWGGPKGTHNRKLKESFWKRSFFSKK
jgi:dipeptidyl-peptidase-4